MNELLPWLAEQPNRLRAALEQSGGPTLLWIAKERDQGWLFEILPRLGPLGGMLAEARLPLIETNAWNRSMEQAVSRDGRPEGSWLAFLESGGRGLLAPDDGGPPCWSVLTLVGEFWLPWRLFFNHDGRSLQRVEADPSACMAGSNGQCIPLNCDGDCVAERYITPYPCRKCVCRGRHGS